MTRIPYGPDSIKMLAALLHETGLKEIEIRERENSIRMVRAVHEAEKPEISPEGARRSSGKSATPALPDEVKQDDSVVTSPMVGLVYLTAEPDSPPLVTPGTKVKAGQVLLMLEAMKTFSHVTAPRDGTVTEILVTSGDAVEFGQPLLRLE